MGCKLEIAFGMMTVNESRYYLPKNQSNATIQMNNQILELLNSTKKRVMKSNKVLDAMESHVITANPLKVRQDNWNDSMAVQKLKELDTNIDNLVSNK